MPTIGIVKSRILTFFEELGAGIPISVRMLFCFGKESQVYKIASELAKRDRLARVVWGVYMLPNEDGSMPSAEAIALAKAQGFGKAIFDLDEDLKHNMRNLKLMCGNPVALFATSGASSSFKYKNGTIVFYKVANRKIELLKERIGMAFATFWKLFTRRKGEMDHRFEKSQISEIDKKSTPHLLELMPMWLKTDLRELYEEFPWELGINDALFNARNKKMHKHSSPRTSDYLRLTS
ncbi:MAG: hypothetical protein K2X77_17640 [Candidatus Obscuribacterales bacterium]|jgi:hypothetical protein|nr:hypothetical protein [Candidatus Obscuribacterales bacterium]